jgi:hypothetical protein
VSTVERLHDGRVQALDQARLLAKITLHFSMMAKHQRIVDIAKILARLSIPKIISWHSSVHHHTWCWPGQNHHRRQPRTTVCLWCNSRCVDTTTISGCEYTVTSLFTIRNGPGQAISRHLRLSAEGTLQLNKLAKLLQKTQKVTSSTACEASALHLPTAAPFPWKAFIWTVVSVVRDSRS